MLTRLIVKQPSNYIHCQNCEDHNCKYAEQSRNRVNVRLEFLVVICQMQAVKDDRANEQHIDEVNRINERVIKLTLIWIRDNSS